MQTFEKEILIPHIIYRHDPIKSIKSKLGNDITIASYTVSDALTPNEEFLVKVVYSAIDFSPFEIYKVINVKRVNTNSDKYIGEVVTNNNDEKTDNETKNDANKNDANNEPAATAEPAKAKKQFVKLNKNVGNCLVKINTLNNTNDDIVYYGDIITNIEDVLTNFCSAFDSIKLSYHGTMITTNINKDKPISELLPKNLTNYDKNIDKRAFDEFQSISHEYSRNYFDVSYLKQQLTANDIIKLTKDYTIKETGIYYFGDLSFNQLSEVLLRIRHGIFFLLSNRSSPAVFIYVNNPDFVIKPKLIEHFLMVLIKDIENVNILLNTK